MLTIGGTTATTLDIPERLEDFTRDGKYMVFLMVANSEIWMQRVDNAERRALVQARLLRVKPACLPTAAGCRTR